MRWIPLAAIGVLVGSAVAYAQIINPSGGGGTPGGSNTQLQFNTGSTFGGISGVTSDSASVGFATSSQLILYGFTSGDCVKIGTSNQLADSGGACGGSGAPGGVNSQVQFNTGGTFGGISGATSNATNISFTTNSLVINGQAISNVSGATGTLASVTGALGSNCVQGDGSGNLTTTGAPCATQPSIAAGSNITTSGTSANTTVNVVATPSFTTVIASGNITAGTAQFTGLLTGTSAVFQTITINNLTPTGPNCLQETGSVLQATNAPCASQVTTVSIAAGNNIVTSGTAANITVTATPTGASNTVQFNNAGVFGGDAGFQYAGGSSGIVTHTLGSVTTTNARALSIIGTLSSSTVQFDAPLFMNITTSGFAAGSKLADVQASGISVFSVSPSGALSSSALLTAQCLQSSAGGLIFGTAVPCATQTSTPSIAAGTNITTSGTAANTTINMVPTTPEFGLQYNHAGLLTADSGFTAFSGIATLTLGNQTTTNARSLSIISTLSSGTVQFDAPLFMNITTNAFASGSKLVDVQGSGISFLSVFASTGMTVLGNITGTQTAVIGWLTAPGVNMQTATLAGALIGTSGNFSTNLTGNIAQFAGFMSAGGASLSGLTIQTATFSSNLTGTTANFSSNLTANIAQFAGFLSAGGASLSGLTIVTETLTGNLTGTTANFSSFTGGAAFSATPTVGAASISFISPSVAQFGLSNTIGNGGWINWGGEARIAADFGIINSSALTPTALSVNVLAGRTYSIDADIYLNLGAGGIQVALSGTYGSTDTHYFGYAVDGGAQTGAFGTLNSPRGAALSSAKNGVVANTQLSGTTGYVSIKGTVTVSSPGTLKVVAAQNSSSSANTTLTRGSRLLVHDMP